MEAYNFTYLDRDGTVFCAFEVECEDDAAAIHYGLHAKQPGAAVVEIRCAERTVAKRRLDIR